MKAPAVRALLLLAVAAAHPAHARAAAVESNSLPGYSAADPGAPAVAPDNLLASERFWPYHVATTRALAPALRAGTTGVLIRVEPTGVARIDFGRDGLRELPVGATDLIERANRIRTGEAHKSFPNFLMALGPRLVDARAATLRQYALGEAAGRRGFLCVFADPNAEGFPALARSLAALDRRDVLPILLPQGEQPDGLVLERLRAVGWSAPFVYDHLAESYTRSLLPAHLAPPALQLATPDGRVLFESGWSDATGPSLAAALDAAFPRPTARKEASTP